MADEKKIKGKALREFRDAGTETLFEAGETYEFGKGAYGNYHAAGLVESADDDSEVAEPLPAPTPPRTDD